MKLVKLIVRNALRNRRRTALMAAGIGVAVFVATSVMAVQAGFGTLAGGGSDSVLNVYEKNVACAVTSRVFDTYLGPIRKVPSVVSATGVLKGLYTYQSKDNLVPVEGVDYEAFRPIGKIRLQDGSEAEFLATGDGALVGRTLARRYGWHVGDTVAMVEGLAVRVAGVFSSSNASYERELLLHKSYLASVQRDEGQSTYLAVKVQSVDAIGPVARSIDESFANYPRPTKTQSERASHARQARDFDAIRWMLSGMVLATILASLFGAANSVSMSVRERTREVGILRSLGLRKSHVLAIVLGESMLVAIFGGIAGVGVSWALLASERLLSGIVPVVVSAPTALLGLGMAIGVGLAGALVPAVIASKLAIVDALRIVD